MLKAVTPKRTIDNHITAKKALLIEGFFYFCFCRSFFCVILISYIIL